MHLQNRTKTKSFTDLQKSPHEIAIRMRVSKNDVVSNIFGIFFLKSPKKNDIILRCVKEGERDQLYVRELNYWSGNVTHICELVGGVSGHVVSGFFFSGFGFGPLGINCTNLVYQLITSQRIVGGQKCVRWVWR